MTDHFSVPSRDCGSSHLCGGGAVMGKATNRCHVSDLQLCAIKLIKPGYEFRDILLIIKPRFN